MNSFALSFNVSPICLHKLKPSVTRSSEKSPPHSDSGSIKVKDTNQVPLLSCDWVIKSANRVKTAFVARDWVHNGQLIYLIVAQ